MSIVQQAICAGLLVLLCTAGPGQAQPTTVAAIANYTGAGRQNQAAIETTDKVR